MPALLLVRHGQASFGAADYDVLSELGEQQAKILAHRLEQMDPPTRIVEGTMVRQRDTAAIIGDRLPGVPRSVDPRWDEYDHEDLLRVVADDPDYKDELDALKDQECSPARMFQAMLETSLRRWLDSDGSGYAESWPAFVNRVWSAADELLDDLSSGETALAVTSGGVISAVCTAALDLGPTQWLRLNRVVVNTSLTRVVRGQGGTNIVSINDHAHLEGHDDLLTYR
jgi:broad specificity phosphatase PhoE